MRQPHCVQNIGIGSNVRSSTAQAEQALEDALPALEAAAEALNNLKKDEITEIRSFAKPHILVQKVLLELDMFLDAATFNWMNELKKFMV